jgi:hypothetical protein
VVSTRLQGMTTSSSVGDVINHFKYQEKKPASENPAGPASVLDIGKCTNFRCLIYLLIGFFALLIHFKHTNAHLLNVKKDMPYDLITRGIKRF